MINKLSLASCCILACGLAFAPAARADLSYTQSTSSALGGMMGGGGAGLSTIKYFSKGEKQRMETSMMGSKTITLTQCGSKASTVIDTSNRIYTTYTGGEAAAMMKDNKNMGKLKPSSISVKVVNLGTTTVNGKKASHYRVDMDMKMNNRPMKTQMEVWGSTTPMHTCPGMSAEAAQALTKNMGMFAPGNIKISGDMKSLAGAFRNVPLRQKISMNGAEFVTINTTNISTAPVSGALFSPPAGYRKVSNQEFQNIQMKAMQAKMGDMFKGMPGMDKMKMP